MVHIMAVTIVWRFVFIFVWKSIPPMEDKFLAIFTTIAISMIFLMLSIIRAVCHGKPSRNLIICSGTYEPNLDLLGPPFPLAHPVFIVIEVIIYLGLYMSILVKKGQVQKNPINPNQIPKKLESLIMNLVVLAVITIAVVSNAITNRYNIKHLPS